MSKKRKEPQGKFGRPSIGKSRIEAEVKARVTQKDKRRYQAESCRRGMRLSEWMRHVLGSEVDRQERRREKAK